MKNRIRLTAVLVTLSLLVALPAVAGVYRVQLKNGNSFETRYQPRVAEWDENKVVLLTDVGNRIALHMDDIVDVIHDTQVRGFGTVIDTTTVVLGWAPNDAPTDTTPSPEAQFQQYLDSLRGPQRENTVNQFVNAEDAGRTGGLSTWEFSGDSFSGSGPGGGNQTFVVPAPPQMQPVAESGGGNDGS